MKTPLIPFASAALLVLGSPPLLAGNQSAVEDLRGAGAVTVLVHGRAREYRRVTSTSPLTFLVQGPTQLRVVSRAQLPEGSGRAIAYHLRVREGDRVLVERVFESEPATAARLASGRGQVCTSRSLTLDLPVGKHRLALSVGESEAALIRLVRAQTSKAASVAYAPVDAPRSVTLSQGEKLVPYYSLLPGKPIKFQVEGPTGFDLVTRLDFAPDMRGRQSYSLRISQDGKPLRDVELHTVKSATATYVELKDLVPSRSHRVRVPIRAGVHALTVELLEPKQGSAELNARLLTSSEEVPQ